MREPIFEKCKGKLEDVEFTWKFEMINNKPCRGMIGCHRLDLKNSSKVHDLEVLVIKEGPMNVFTTHLINNEHTRYYWNLSHIHESLSMVLKYNTDSEIKTVEDLPKVTCFAWCNPQMLDYAPPSFHYHSSQNEELPFIKDPDKQ